MKKIGIISELNMHNVNYGNRLQAYALNKYLNENYKNIKTESLYFSIYDKKKFSKKFISQTVKRELLKLKNKVRKNKVSKRFVNRLNACNDFTLNSTKLSDECLDWKKLKKVDYDLMIVGSDVVWAQNKGGINRIRFLNFKTQKKFKKISYAASFGRDYIPEENKKILKECLSEFDGISVREKSSIKLLQDIGIEKTIHVCDPTLLLEKEEWKKIGKEVNVNNDKFIFVYLLGKNKEQREKIVELAKKEKLKIVTVPDADGNESDIDQWFGDYLINDCSPENWIWLINNAEFVITDSFHGAIFATIFHKKFVILKREYGVNINNRMIDYLDTIKEDDKFIHSSELKNISNFKWDYVKIQKEIDEFRKKSIEYIECQIKDIMEEDYN